MTFQQIFRPQNIVFRMESEDKDEAFEELVQCAVSSNSGIDREEVLAGLRRREAQMSTGIARGIAVPHTYCSGVGGVLGVIGISRSGIDYDALDGEPVNIIFMLLSAPGNTEQHLQSLSMLARIMRAPDFFDTVLSQESPKSVFDALCAMEAPAL